MKKFKVLKRVKIYRTLRLSDKQEIEKSIQLLDKILWKNNRIGTITDNQWCLVNDTINFLCNLKGEYNCM